MDKDVQFIIKKKYECTVYDCCLWKNAIMKKKQWGNYTWKYYYDIPFTLYEITQKIINVDVMWVVCGMEVGWAEYNFSEFKKLMIFCIFELQFSYFY